MTETKINKSFRSLVENYSARHIVDSTGCSLPTAYDWRSGRRAPPKWLQDHFLDCITSYLKK